MENSKSHQKIVSYLLSVVSHKDLQKAKDLLRAFLKHGYAAIRSFVAKYARVFLQMVQRQSLCMGNSLLDFSRRFGASFAVTALALLRTAKAEVIW